VKIEIKDLLDEPTFGKPHSYMSTYTLERGHKCAIQPAIVLQKERNQN